MSTQYPILYDRPINKWKVAELKEELKRRNLMIKGLKDDLVRRLAEAIHNERSNLEVQQQVKEPLGFDEAICQERENVGAQGQRDMHHINEPLGFDEPICNERENMGQSDLHNIKEPLGECKTADDQEKDVNDVIVGNCVGGDDLVDGTFQRDEGKADGASVSVPSLVGLGIIDNSDDTANKTDDLLSIPIAFSEDLLENSGASNEKSNLRSDDLGQVGNLEASIKSRGSPNELVDQQAANGSENKENIITEAENEEIDVLATASREKAWVSFGTEMGNEYVKPIQTDAESHVTHPSNQVYEVSSNLGFQVQCESIITDTVNLSDSGKTEIKENLNANNVQLEPEVVRQEVVQSSSHKDSSGDDRLYPLDNKVPDVKQGLVVEADEKCDMKSSEKPYSADDVSVIDHIMENRAPDQVADENEYGELLSAAKINLEDTLKPDMPLDHMGPTFEEKLDVAASVEQRKLQDNISSDANFSELVDVDMKGGEPLEKINLDQSSADDSIEDDMLDMKQTDSDFNPSKVGNEIKPIEEIIVDAASTIESFEVDIPANISEPSDATTDKIASPSEKRKFECTIEGEPAQENKEIRKRQRRWNEGSVKMPEGQGLDVSVSKPSITTASIDGYKPSSGDLINERVVPPSSKAPTNSLRIHNFLRPFTLKAVQQLLSKTGAYSAFWMDQIKTHCYVTYTSVEEATETRNAIYNLRWPANGGRLLIAEFVDPEEVKTRLEAPSQAAAPVNSSSVPASLPPGKQTAPGREQDTKQATSGPATRKGDGLAGTRSPVDGRDEPPIVTLDDLFRKTKATPRIYYLPLTKEEVAVKLGRQRK